MTKEWLYLTAVKRKDYRQWFQQVVDPTHMDQFFDLPTAADLTDKLSVQKKVRDASVLRYPQHNCGICGILTYNKKWPI